jgi:hypothetical protein
MSRITTEQKTICEVDALLNPHLGARATTPALAFIVRHTCLLFCLRLLFFRIGHKPSPNYVVPIIRNKKASRIGEAIESLAQSRKSSNGSTGNAPASS